MADEYLSSHDAIENKQSFFNVIKDVGWEDTPFFTSLSSVPFEGDPKLGHTWFYRKRPDGSGVDAFSEGSDAAEVKKYGATKLSNELQIIKDSYGVTKSQKDALTIEGKKNSLEKQSAMSAVNIALKLERALLGNGAPVPAAGEDDVRKLGGIYHYIVNEIDANTAALNWKVHVRAAFETMWKNGAKAKVLMCNSTQKDAIDDMFSENKRYGMAEGTISDNFSVIGDATYAKNVKIITSPLIAQSDILIYDPALIDIVLHRQVKSEDISTPGLDAERYQHLFELTMQVTDPYSIMRIKNLAV